MSCWGKLSVAGVLGLLLGACGGDDGDPCKEQNDCTNGLSCCPLDRSPLERGTCRPVCPVTELPPGLGDASIPAG